MSSWKSLLLSFFGGAIAFWSPYLIVEALYPNEQGYAMTLACSTLLILFYIFVLRLRKAERSGPSTAIFALCGIWILALLFLLLPLWVRPQNGIAFDWRKLGYVLLSSFMPLRILQLVTFGGNLFAFMIGTLAMISCHAIFERPRWILPPSLSAALHRLRVN
jgi:hypothetical protein